MYKKIIVILSIISFANYTVLSNSEDDFWQNKYFSASYHYGFLVHEYSYHKLHALNPINSFELCFSKKSLGNSIWQNIYNYPELGVSAYFSGLSNKELYGNLSSVYVFTASDFLKDKKINIDWKLGLGIAYVTRKFDFENNYHNISVGSHFNGFFRAEIGWKYNFFKHITFRQALVFNHISNVNMAEPNIGLNWISLKNSIYIKPINNIIKQNIEIPKYQKTFFHQIILSGGLKHTKSFEAYQYITGSLAYKAVYKPSYISSIALGGDIFYDSAVKTIMEKKNKDFTPKDSWQTGFFIQFALHYNKLSFGLQQGIYVFLLEQTENHKYYNRAFIQWDFNDIISGKIAMKTHLQVLDHVQVGVGYKIFKHEK
jgi:hypothetical protein